MITKLQYLRANQIIEGYEKQETAKLKLATTQQFFDAIKSITDDYKVKNGIR